MKKYILYIPNILTYGRIFSVPLVVICFFLEGHLSSTNASRWIAFSIFIIASITDFFDGYLARIWQQTSDFGRAFDPIADKLLVSSCLLLLAAEGTIAGWTLWAGIIILCREIIVSGLREYLSDFKISIPVSRLSKWKTTLQLIAISFLIIGPAGDIFFSYTTKIGLILLWIAAILTLITGWNYYCAVIKKIYK